MQADTTKAHAPILPKDFLLATALKEKNTPSPRFYTCEYGVWKRAHAAYVPQADAIPPTPPPQMFPLLLCV